MYFSFPEFLPHNTVPMSQHEVLLGPGWQGHSCLSYSASFRCWSEPMYSFSGTLVPLPFSAIGMLSATWLSFMYNDMAFFLPLKLPPKVNAYLKLTLCGPWASIFSLQGKSLIALAQRGFGCHDLSSYPKSKNSITLSQGVGFNESLEPPRSMLNSEARSKP